MDREVLKGVGVAVLEPAVVEAVRGDLPATADRGQGVGRCPAALVQFVKCERTPLAGSDVRQLLDAEVVRLLFDLHGARRIGVGAQKEIGRSPDSKPSPNQL